MAENENIEPTEEQKRRADEFLKRFLSKSRFSELYTMYEEEAFKKRPRCFRCKHRITDDTLFDVDGELFCGDCMAELYERDTWLYEE